MRFNKRSISTILSLTLASSSCSALIIHANSPQSFEEFRDKYNSQEYLIREHDNVMYTVQKRVYASSNDESILQIELHNLNGPETKQLIEDLIRLIDQKNYPVKLR